ncbi:MAG: hypothetical protein IT442_08120 [Phycisphaeraceae bacterium]|nr:hypothetical protein [Phycisphaeraceae bacterium]
MTTTRRNILARSRRLDSPRPAPSRSNPGKDFRGRGRFRGRGGFTLLELLVAIGLTVFMLVAIQQIFSGTEKTVGYGIGLSQVIQNSRVMVEQLRTDAAMMLGPDGTVPGATPGMEKKNGRGGMLIILQKEINAPVTAPGGQGVWIRDGSDDHDENPLDHFPAATPGDRRALPRVRSDQLIFIRARGDEQPIAPSANNNLTPEHVEQDCKFIRVWYGHILRSTSLGDPYDNPNTNEDLTVAPANNTNPPPYNDAQKPGLLGQRPDTSLQDPETRKPLVVDNELASQWGLGRQALFMRDGGMALPGQAEGTDSRMNQTIHANGSGNYSAASYNADVVGYSSSLPNQVPPKLYMGLTDVAYMTFDDPTTWGARVGGGGMLVGGSVLLPSLSNDATTIWEMDDPRKTNTGSPYYVAGYPTGGATLLANIGQYRNRVYPLTFGVKHLRVVPRPTYVDGDPDRRFGAYQFAQTHPYFMQGVSDFIVEFALDFFPADDEAGPSTHAIPGLPLPADIQGQDKHGLRFRYRHGNLAWWTAFANQPATNGTYDSLEPPTLPAGNLTFVPGLNNFEAYDPAPNMPHADAAFVFRHDDSNPKWSTWPYLLRVRWRMHDSSGRLVDGADGIPGQWFEVILPVNRPRP